MSDDTVGQKMKHEGERLGHSIKEVGEKIGGVFHNKEGGEDKESHASKEEHKEEHKDGYNGMDNIKHEGKKLGHALIGKKE